MRRHTRAPGLVFAVAVGLVCAGASALASDSSGDRDYSEAMAREHAGDQPVASPAAAAEPKAAIVGSEVAYATLGGKTVRGYLSRPEAAGPHPGVLVIHEWWGLNDNIRAMARQLAGEGYTVLAVDLYEGEYAGDRERAKELMLKSMKHRDRLEDNLRQARAYLAGEAGATRVGTIGWCFGGGWSLGAALLMPGQIDATVIYYGRVVTDEAALAALETPILGLFGAEDRGIPVSSVRAFESALERLGKPVSIQVYAGANHAFANPSGTRYDESAAKDAWARTLAFLERYLQ